MINQSELNLIIQNHKSIDKVLSQYPAVDSDIMFFLIEAHSDRKKLLGVIGQFQPRPFDPSNRETWPEMETEVLVRFDFGWKIAKLCYTVLAKNPIWKTENGSWDYASAIEWQLLPEIKKEEEG